MVRKHTSKALSFINIEIDFKIIFIHFIPGDLKQFIRDGDEMSVRAALKGGTELNVLDGASGMTLLMLASAACQDNIVELLLRRQADVNAVQKNGMTALMHACEQVSLFYSAQHFLLM